MIEFTPPDFMEENDVDTILERMQSELPSNIVPTPGSMAYNFIMPTAIEKSQMIENHLMETLMLMFPMWAYDEWLDYHASLVGIERKGGVAATGECKITGPPGVKIEEGFLFTTEGTEDMESKEYICDKEYCIDDSGEINVAIRAVNVGEEYNALPQTVILMDKPMDGVAVMNEEEITGGIDLENDDYLRQRIQEKNENMNTSYVGSIADYKRWAEGRPGVGECIVQDVWKGPGTVRLIIIGYDGKPIEKGSSVLEDVYNYIMKPNNPQERLIPAGGIELTVDTLTEFKLNYTASVILTKGYTLEEVEKSFKEKLNEYYSYAKVHGILKYNKIYAILTSIDGVDDFEELFVYHVDTSDDQLVGNGKSNIAMESDDYPITIDVKFTKGGLL